MRASCSLLISIVLSLALTGCRKNEDVELTPWFTVRYTRPTVSTDYPLRALAESATAQTRIENEWLSVSETERSTYLRAVAFAGGTRVLLQNDTWDWRIFRQGSLVPVRIPEEHCKSFAYVTGAGNHVICPECTETEGSDGACARLRVHVLDGDGRVLVDREVDLAGSSKWLPSHAQFVGQLPDDTVLFNIQHAGPEHHPQYACRLIGVNAKGEQELMPLSVIDYCYRLSDWPRPTRELPVRLPAWDSYDQLEERVSPGCG
jgi:hypothetical protein